VQSSIDFNANLKFYKNIKLEKKEAESKASCSIIHIGACQDNQMADDGSSSENNGKFTLAVGKILEDGGNKKSYETFFQLLKNEMPPWQTPTWDTKAGREDSAFEKSIIFEF
jgi:hypothetical protein